MELARRIRFVAPVQWNRVCPEDEQELNSIARSLAHDAVEAARRAGYFNARSLGASHDLAVRKSNQAARSVARTMGFTYPEKHELQF